MRVIVYLGSDYNGLNATVSQVLIVLGLIEGGFTTASLVALYKPYASNDELMINKILSTTKGKFQKIGLLTFIAGIIICVVYSFLIKTSIDYWTVLLIFLMSVVSMSFNVFYVAKFRLLYQVSQNDYMISLVGFATSALSLIITLVVFEITRSILLLRLIAMVFAILNGLIIAIVAKRKFKFVSFKKEHEDIVIKGTKDVLIGKVTDFVYTSASIFFISSFIGTTQTSIFAVYNNVVIMVVGLIVAIIASPANALGQVVGEGNKQRLKELFDEYEYDVILISSIILSVTFIMILPFVRIFTAKATDADYIQPILALILVLTPFFQMIHIPSGLLINYTGHFRAVRIIQTIMCVFISVTSLIGALLFGLYGIMIAKLISNFVLVGMEVFYSRKKLLLCGFKSFFRNATPNFIFASIIAAGGFYFTNQFKTTWTGFFLLGFLVLIINTILFTLFNSVVYKKEFGGVVNRVQLLIKPIVNRFKK